MDFANSVYPAQPPFPLPQVTVTTVTGPEQEQKVSVKTLPRVAENTPWGGWKYSPR